MTPPEQERTVRLIAKRRNQERMKALQKKEDEEQAAKEKMLDLTDKAGGQA